MRIACTFLVLFAALSAHAGTPCESSMEQVIRDFQGEGGQIKNLKVGEVQMLLDLGRDKLCGENKYSSFDFTFQGRQAGEKKFVPYYGTALVHDKCPDVTCSVIDYSLYQGKP